MGTTYNALANAIVQEENSTWPNNPGAMQSVSGQKINFGSFGAGFQALLSKLQNIASGQSSVYSPNMTLQQFENTYTGGNPTAGVNIAQMLGVSPNTPFSALSDQALTNSAAVSTPSTPSTPSTAEQIANMIGGGVTGSAGGMPVQGIPVNPATGAPNPSSGGFSIPADATAILLGLILVLGAVFSFTQMKDTVVRAAKGAALA